jgi:clan AA aspartic protease (TIGR02281 family)
MVRAWVSSFCAVTVLITVCGAAPVGQSPEDVLKARGLTKVGRIYLLEGDIKLPEAMRRFMAAKKAADDDSAKRATLEREVRGAKEAVAGLNVKLANISQRELKTKKKDVFERNRLVAEQNLTVSQLHEAEKYAADREAELAKLSGEPQDKYSAVVLEVSDQMEAVAKQYEELAADEAVKGAIKAIDERDPAKVTLGPSAQFKQQLVFVRNQRAKVATGVVKFKFDSGTPQVMVELNGAVREEMVLDTGASYVSISWPVARRLGLSPGKNDPTVKTIIANGKTEDARLMTLRSVRLGQFTAQNVPCIVTPASAGDTPLLLGGSFLRNFVYRMDMTAHELHMTQLSAKPEALATPVAVTEGPAATSQPAGPKVEAGFTPLFNGRDLTGWTYGTGDRGEGKTGAGYQVRDGIIYCTNEDGGNLFTEKEYGDFVLRFEFKLTESANNGIGIRTPPSGDPAYVGMEIQVLDDNGKEYRDKAGHSKLRPNQLHGSIYDVVAARPGYLKPVGEWNSEEIRAEGRRITVTLNGSVILSADLDSVKGPAVLKKHPGLKNERGRIGLLGHGSAVEFRNLRVKEL